MYEKNYSFNWGTALYWRGYTTARTSSCADSPRCLYITWMQLSCYETPQKRGARRKAFTLHTATPVLRLLRTHSGPLRNINIRWKMLQASTPRFLHCAWSSTAVGIIEALFQHRWGGILARNLWGNWLTLIFHTHQALMQPSCW